MNFNGSQEWGLCDDNDEIGHSWFDHALMHKFLRNNLISVVKVNEGTIGIQEDICNNPKKFIIGI